MNKTIAAALLATLGTAHAADIEPHWHAVGDGAPGLEIDLSGTSRSGEIRTAIWRSHGGPAVAMIILEKDCAPSRKVIKYTMASGDTIVHETVRRGANTVAGFLADFVCGTAK